LRHAGDQNGPMSTPSRRRQLLTKTLAFGRKPRSLGTTAAGSNQNSADEATPSDQSLISDLRAALSPEQVRTDRAQRGLLRNDASVFAEGHSGPVCFPTSTTEVQQVVKIAAKHERAIVPRGAGTGLAGGAIPLGAPVVIALSKMNKILEVDLENEVAWVQPGVINLDLTKHLTPFGYHFAPDPSSQQVCTVGGNVANNSGGPHCLAYGVTNTHIMAVEVVLPSGQMALLGGIDPEPAGLDLRGAFVGGEGMLGVATRIAVRITPNPRAVKTLLLSFPTVDAAANTVSKIIGAGVVPAALEVMDQRIIEAIEAYVQAGYPTDAAAVLLAEVDGHPSGIEIDAATIERIGRENEALAIRVAQDEAERQLLWKGRKTAFGAIARIAPDYYLHDTVVPRAKLAQVLTQVYEIADRHEVLVMNVFHAGDGNLHPLIVFDGREPGTLDRVHAAGREIVEASLAAGGALSGEHGIGIEKQDYMPLMFSDQDLAHQALLRASFDPDCRSNPGKVLPAAHSCADIQALRQPPEGVWG